MRLISIIVCGHINEDWVANQQDSLVHRNVTSACDCQKFCMKAGAGLCTFWTLNTIAKECHLSNYCSGFCEGEFAKDRISGLRDSKTNLRLYYRICNYHIMYLKICRIKSIFITIIRSGHKPMVASRFLTVNVRIHNDKYLY